MDVGVFSSLVSTNQIPQVVKGIESAVLRSFEEDRQPGRIILTSGVQQTITRDKVKDRTQRCIKIFRVLRGDLHWGVARIVDSLPRILRQDLDRVNWEPEARRSTWAAKEST